MKEAADKERKGRKDKMEDKKTAFDKFTKDEATLKDSIASLKDALAKGLDGDAKTKAEKDVSDKETELGTL